MKLSTQSRYGTRFLVELAKYYSSNTLVPLKVIAEAQQISRKYLTIIVLGLKRAGLIESVYGRNGGYRLAKHPSQITIKDILVLFEDGCRLVPCTNNQLDCKKRPSCPTRTMWSLLEHKIIDAMSTITLLDFMQEGSTPCEKPS